jgi:sugar O-acyltransferase (sialic acid O-acetyltransferase NeuD family)
MKTLAIIGASGHGKVVADAAISSGQWDDVVFYDDAWPSKTLNGNSEIVGNTRSLLALVEKPSIIVAIGNNKIRLEKQRYFAASGFDIATVVHPSSVISKNASIGHGTVAMAGSVINADAKVGEACIVNTNAVIEHDCALADAVHISPGACLAGGVFVGECSWVGIGASVIQQKVIGKNVKVGANAAVVTDLPDNVTAVGVPARIIK